MESLKQAHQPGSWHCPCAKRVLLSSPAKIAIPSELWVTLPPGNFFFCCGPISNVGLDTWVKSWDWHTNGKPTCLQPCCFSLLALLFADLTILGYAVWSWEDIARTRLTRCGFLAFVWFALLLSLAQFVALPTSCMPGDGNETSELEVHLLEENI